MKTGNPMPIFSEQARREWLDERARREAARTCAHCDQPVRGPRELTCGGAECLRREYGP